MIEIVDCSDSKEIIIDAYAIKLNIINHWLNYHH